MSTSDEKSSLTDWYWHSGTVVHYFLTQIKVLSNNAKA